jgi:putative hydrolase
MHDQGADGFRLRAYLRAAESVRSMPRSINQIFRAGGLEGLTAVPHIGEGIARAIRELLVHGRLPMLDRLRGKADAIGLLSSVAGIGPVLARRLHEQFCGETQSTLITAEYGTLAGRRVVAGREHER